MTELDLTPIKDRLARAHTEWGEWIVESDEWGVCHSVIIQDDGPGYSVIAEGVIQGEDDGLADAIFIAAAPTDIAALLAEVERLRAQVQREAAEPHLRAKWVEELERAMFKVESVHHFGFGYHGFKCLCGFESLRNRSRTEHITQAVRNLLEGAGE